MTPTPDGAGGPRGPAGAGSGTEAGAGVNAPLLRIRDLTVSFGSRTVVELDELSIDHGEILGLAGESGAGKSITGMAILGLTRHTGARVTGSIKLNGIELTTANARVLRSLRGTAMTLIPQSPGSSFNPVLPVGRTVLRTLRLHGYSKAEARRKAEEAMAKVWLETAHLDRYPHQLSGGQLQRVAIALGLALGAQLLIADEPTSALDVTVQAEICGLLGRLHEDGISILFVSHDLAVLAGLCDRIAVMRGGRLVEQRPALDLVHFPREDYTRRLLEAVPRLGSATTGGGMSDGDHHA